MITQKDIEKLKETFATKEEMSKGFREIISFIGEMRDQTIELLSKQMNDFREEMRDINRNNRSTLDNHEVRINRLEYTGK